MKKEQRVDALLKAARQWQNNEPSGGLSEEVGGVVGSFEGRTYSYSLYRGRPVKR